MCRSGRDHFDFENVPCRARKSSPCSAGRARMREIVRPASPKWAKNAVFRRVGRVFSRKCRWRSRAGRVFSRKCRWRSRAGRVFSRQPVLRTVLLAPCALPACSGGGFALHEAFRPRVTGVSDPRVVQIPPRRHNKTARRAAGRGWSGRRESNPPLKLGKLPFYR